jgi:Zn finger protein HypA/HybF involved in hydrogenase expression
MAQLEGAIPSVARSGEIFEAAKQDVGGNAKTEFASEYCPRCSTRLAARSCKMICPGCGYYMSCSDFY